MSFPLIGNSKICLAVENALKEQRIPHAILIDGDIGTGRHTLAFYLSRATLCSGDDIPCGECRSCKLAIGGNHPDITVISPEEGKKGIGVAQIRKLKSSVYIKPHEAKGRVFIIDCADTLNEQSQNALLKVLEEPPSGCVFILIAESKASLLDTIISRCVILSLNTPNQNEAMEYLSACCDYQGEDIENALISARNNIGKALMLLKGKADSRTAMAAKEFLEHILRGNAFEALLCVTPFEKDRSSADRLLKDLKLVLWTELKKNPKSVNAAGFLELYNEISRLNESLVTNINLSLLFAHLTTQAKEILG